jgi:hypothetical protein
LERFDARWRGPLWPALCVGWEINQRLAQFDDSAWNEKIKLLARFPAEAIPVLLQGDWAAPALVSLLWRHRRRFSLTQWRTYYKNIWKKA